ncbi:hypothetical protein BUALT_Bualt06G0023400 [Buddleja alternifolia]|uniref:Uncharacterized protein n=1 Tax=Buddleja alternifolia TaxID=168488 RepID=A0AAV6XJE1_9LAMI|nr:hypothetical protein BUALT_Bualt06G0023400 [Buddleja alternifolia]
MTDYHDVEMWIGGKFVEGEKLTYEVRHKHEFVNVDVDIFSLDDIYEMYVSEFDDSSDSDYIQPFYYSEDEDEYVCNKEDEDDKFVQDVDFDTPSIILEYLKTSNDDDIFLPRNTIERDFTRKLRKMINRAQAQAPQPSSHTIGADVEAANWYIDLGEEDEIETLDLKEDAFPFFR